MVGARLSTVLASATFAVTVGASEYQDAWGPPVGSPLPAIQAPDQTGTDRDLASLQGQRGLLLFMVRSADW